MGRLWAVLFYLNLYLKSLLPVPVFLNIPLFTKSDKSDVAVRFEIANNS